MLIQNVLSAPVFLALLFLTYTAMWIYISRHDLNREKNQK
jgi:hypothetical protein